MRRILTLAVTALAVLALAGSAQAKPDPAHTLAYTSVTAGGQPSDAAGHPTGPPEVADPLEHRPSAADLAGRGNAGPPVNPRVGRLESAAGCYTAWAERRGWSTLGSLLWSFRHTARFCWDNNNTITGLTRTVDPQPHDSIWFYQTGSLVSRGNWYVFCCSNPKSGHYGYRGGHFYSKVNGFVISNVYPYVEIWVHGDGRWTYNTGV